MTLEVFRLFRQDRVIEVEKVSAFSGI